MKEIINNKTVNEGKLIAALSYIIYIGLIIALVLNNNKRNAYVSFHIRQSLGLALLSIVIGLVSFIPFIGWALGIILSVFWIVGFVQAILGKTTPLPFVGIYFQKMFSSI